MDELRLIVGLGNPGADYARTRHNAGFMVADILADRWRASWGYEKKFDSRLAKSAAYGRKILLCEPQTYMNSSGTAVSAVAGFYRVGLNDLLVMVDDADLPLGELRMRPGGGSAGHHGLESIEAVLSSNEYPRLRIGIGRQDGQRQITGFVLGRFASTDRELLDTVLGRAADQVECWLQFGIQKAMSKFNGRVNPSDNEGKQ
jgi:PTH1 family peptidyl-tRNA hydrolase